MDSSGHLSRAEHAADSSAIVVTDSQQLAQEALAELQKQVVELQRAKDALQSLKKYSAIIVVEDVGGGEQSQNPLGLGMLRDSLQKQYCFRSERPCCIHSRLPNRF